MKRFRSVVALFLLTVLLTAMVPAPVSAAKLMKVTGTKMLRMRTGPSEEYSIKARYKEGTVVTVLKYSKGWYYVQTKSGTKGWMSKNFLKTTTAPVVKAKESASGTAVTLKNSYMRKGPSKSYDRILTVHRGKVVKLIGRTGDWYKVRFGDKTGFIHKSLLRITK